MAKRTFPRWSWWRAESPTCARGYHLVIEKSTVPVQTGRRLQKHFGIYRNDSQVQL